MGLLRQLKPCRFVYLVEDERKRNILLLWLFAVLRFLAWQVKLRRQRILLHIFIVFPSTAKRDRSPIRTTEAASCFVLQVSMAHVSGAGMVCGIPDTAYLSRREGVPLGEEVLLEDIGDSAELKPVPKIMTVPADVMVPMATALQQKGVNHLMHQHLQDLLRCSSGQYVVSELDRYPRTSTPPGSNGPSEQCSWQRGPLEVYVTLKDS